MKNVTAKLDIKQNSTLILYEFYISIINDSKKGENRTWSNGCYLRHQIIFFFSEWASPIFPILKRNGQDQFCGDFMQTVDPVLQIDKYPIPNIEDMYSKVSEWGCFIVWDWI